MKYVIFILLFGTLQAVGQDCTLSLVENRPFMAFANTRVQAPINALSKGAKQEILYLVYVKKTGTYSGVSLLLDDNFKVDTAIRFSYNSKAGFQKMEEAWQTDTLELKNLFKDEACFMNENYKSEGTDELLLCRKMGVNTNGIIYKGCATMDLDKETSVPNKTLLALLRKFRQGAIR